jgi:hypothetical protein
MALGALPKPGRQLGEQIIGCLLAMPVDAMSGVITRRVRHCVIRANCTCIVRRETSAHEYEAIATWS